MVHEIQNIIKALRQEFLSGLSESQLKICFTVFDHIQEQIDHSTGSEPSGAAKAAGNR